MKHRKLAGAAVFASAVAFSGGALAATHHPAAKAKPHAKPGPASNIHYPCRHHSGTPSSSL